MGLDRAHYHGWEGPLRSPWFGCLALVRVALLQLFRRKVYWLVLALGLLNFLLFWSIIYAVTQIQLPREAQEALLERFGFSAEPTGGAENAYVQFMQRQSLVVMVLLAFSGSLLVGSDFQLRSLPFYLSRRIDRRHYIAAKLLAVSAIVSLLTVVPALLLFFEYGMFTASVDYWVENRRIVVSVLGYGLVLCVVLSTWLVALSAWLRKAAPIAITWSTLFAVLGTLAGMLRRTTGNKYWHLIDPWRNMRAVGRLCFDSLTDPEDRRIAWWALAILATGCTVALLALVRRVRAVDVVE
jgi:ABC-type transport system involved in multi-copper enzyme maturation permease subunit